MDFIRRLFASAPPEPQKVMLSSNRDASKTMMSFGAAAGKYNASVVAEVAPQKSYDSLLKVVLMGESGAGKSSLLRRFTNDTFTNAYCSTIGVDFAVKTLSFDGQVVKLQIWDTSGQERFRSITSSYYRGASAVLIVYAVNDEASFRGLERWLEEVRRYCTEGVAVMVVAAKSDLPAVVDQAVARAWAADHGCLFAVTSAKVDSGVFDAFSRVAQAASHGQLSGAAVPSAEKAVAPAPAADQTNVLRVDLTQLQGALQLATGEPLRCGGCGAMFSWLSRLSRGAASGAGKGLKPVELAPPLHPSLQALCARAATAAGGGEGNDNNGASVWECEFCCRANRVEASEAELQEFQRGPTMDFLVRPATEQPQEDAGATTIFVIDCSGRSVLCSLLSSRFSRAWRQHDRVRGSGGTLGAGSGAGKAAGRVCGPAAGGRRGCWGGGSASVAARAAAGGSGAGGARAVRG